MVGFDPRAACFGFMMDKVALEGYLLLLVLRFFLGVIVPRFPHIYAFITYEINSGTID